MTERPILFSGPMVRALLAGRKTQTRRVFNGIEDLGDGEFHILNRGGGVCGVSEADVPKEALEFVRFDIGDRLYVREAWRVSRKHDAIAPRDLEPRSMTVLFEAGGSIANQEDGSWSPSDYEPTPESSGWVGKFRQGMHMPRWASRLTLIVTDVRVERLQDITEADAIAEGIERSHHGKGDQWMNYPAGSSASGWSDPRESFRSLWNSLNAHRGFGWEAHPWVVATTFEVIKQNIDQVSA